MGLGNADIEAAVGEFLYEFVQAGSCRHGGGDHDQIGIVFSHFDHVFAENFREARLGVLRREKFSRFEVERFCAVVRDGVLHSFLHPFPLLRENVDYDWPAGVFHPF